MDVTSHFSSAVPQVVTHVGVGVAVGSGVGVIAGELLGACEGEAVLDGTAAFFCGVAFFAARTVMRQGSLRIFFPCL